MAMGKVIVSDNIVPPKPLIAKISPHYSIDHTNENLTKQTRGHQVVRYPVLAVRRTFKPLRQNQFGFGGMSPDENPVRIVKSSKSERIRTASSKDSEFAEAKSLPETRSPTRRSLKRLQPPPPPPAVFRSSSNRGHIMPSIVNKTNNVSTFERDFWTYWKSVKTGEIYPEDACPNIDRASLQSMQTDTSAKDLNSSKTSSHYLPPPASPDPDKLSIKHIFKFLNMSEANAKKNKTNSLERIRLLQKSVRKRGNTLTTVEMALKNARRYRHPEKQGSNVPALPKFKDELGPIVNSTLLKDTLQTHMSQPAMPVEKAVKHHSFTYSAKQRSRRMKEAYVSKKTANPGKSNVPQSRTMAVFSRQVPDITESSLDGALSHRTATFHDTSRSVYWVEGKKHRTRSQPMIREDGNGGSKVVRLPKVPIDPDDPDDIINGVALVNFSKITEKMNTLGISITEEEFQDHNESVILVNSAGLSLPSPNLCQGPRKHVSVRLPQT